MMQKAKIGVIGLGVMGQNIALNLVRNGYAIAGYDLDRQKVAAFTELANNQLASGFNALADLFDHLESPHILWMMVPAGKIVDQAISTLKPYLRPGDVLIDGGNSHFSDTDRRQADFQATGIHFIGMGVSGGEQGALYGPSLMPGGSSAAWELLNPILSAIAAKVDGEACVSYIGNGSAGHYVKMVHNGIEYGDMQLIAEAYDVLHRGLGLTNHELHNTFSEWNSGILDSYLIQITANIFARKDPETGNDLLDLILDEAQQKGTGKWSSESAFALSSPIPSIHTAVEARVLSSWKEEREAASKILIGPDPKMHLDPSVWVDKVRDGLFAAKICSYAQGFDLLSAANLQYNYELNLGELARIWRGGCIIRARFLDDIRRTYQNQPALKNLMLDPYFAGVLNINQQALREIVSQANLYGIPAASLSASLAYYDAYRTARLPANLIQAQRDYFGSHTYQRIDRSGVFHTDWDVMPE